MLRWIFILNGIVVNEPIGWDSAEFNLQRSDKYTGLENIYSDSFSFDGYAAQALRDLFETDWIDAETSFVIKSSCDGITYTTEFTGVIDMLTFSEENGEVTVSIEDSSFKRKVKNRLDIPVNFNQTESIGGVDIGSANIFNLGLHSKAIVQISETKTNVFSLPFSNSHTFTPANKNIRIEFPLETVVDEIKQLNESSSLINFEVPGLDIDSGTPVFTVTQTGDYLEVTYFIKGSVTVTCADLTDFGFLLCYGYGANADENQTELLSVADTNYSAGTHVINFDYSGTFTFVPSIGQKIYFVIILSNYSNQNSGSPNPSTFTLKLDPLSKINLKQQTSAIPSTCKAIAIFDAFKRCAQAMSDEEDCFVSDFFSIGCGKYTSVSNGKNIRNMLQKDGSYFPIVTSFNELFDSSNAVWNLGMRMEYTDKWRMRVEPKSYFYNITTQLQLLNVSDLKRSPAVELIHNEFECGYEKWNLNISGVNALDEINSKRKFSLPVVNAKKKLLAVSRYIASGYLLEETRRVQFLQNPTTDFETDDDNFFIATNPTGIESDKYSSTGNSYVYSPGTVSERNEHFSSITNLLSPETAYNLRLSPIRMAANWYGILKASLANKTNPVIKFISGEGNFEEGDQLNDSCDQFGGVISQNVNLSGDDLINASALYKPNNLDFSYPMSFGQFKNLVSNSIDSIEVSCSDGNTTKGFIKEIKFFPNSDGGTANFRLIEGICVLGGFDEGFSNGFEIGTC